ncbi:serine/threonine-protein kinase [Streptomyces sp. CA-251387]|uniref:serine/threonine-protein kinase n=1 Tax=Streptomyces sp. CA-251387 TaxID=3240064 RepID=UPI003D93C5FF
MGRVWRAVDEILDRLVAVKEMRIDGLDPEDTRTRRERTLREARATARIDHPNVVRVYDVVDEGERLWIVMELVAGRSLERIMAEEGPLGPCETARIGMGLVAALRQVHARGVLHRDIKPGNVLVESGVAGGRARVVLTDFGIAAIQDAKALTMVGMLVGSPDYMAPERISGRPQGPPSDIWSLGATLSAALAGRSPFSRDTTLATLHAVLYEEPELPPSAGPLRDVLAALLEKDPSIRPALDDVETALQPVAFPEPTPTMPVVGRGAGEPAGQVEEREQAMPGPRETPPTRARAQEPEPQSEPGPPPAPEPTGGSLREPAPTPEPTTAPASMPEPQPEPAPTPTPPGERPTPALLEAPPTPRDPRQPDPVQDAIPPHTSPAPAPAPTVTPTPTPSPSLPPPPNSPPNPAQRPAQKSRPPQPAAPTAPPPPHPAALASPCPVPKR